MGRRGEEQLAEHENRHHDEDGHDQHREGDPVSPRHDRYRRTGRRTLAVSSVGVTKLHAVALIVVGDSVRDSNHVLQDDVTSSLDFATHLLRNKCEIREDIALSSATYSHAAASAQLAGGCRLVASGCGRARRWLRWRWCTAARQG